jgi:hypothetical protein
MFRHIRILYLEATGSKERQKKGMRSRRRSSPYTTESAKIDHRRKLKDVGIDNEDKELMDEGTMSDI